MIKCTIPIRIAPTKILNMYFLFQLTHHNHPVALNDHVLKRFLNNARKLKFQGINEYRKRFGITPFKSFYDMTGDVEFAAVLEEMYGHIDAVEYYVGKFDFNIFMVF